MRCAKCGSETPIGHRCIVDDLEAIRKVDLSDHPLFKREAVTTPEPREDVAVAEGGLTDAEWTRLRHAAGNRGDLGPIAEEFERILAERVQAAAEEALRDAADDLEALVDAQHPDALNPDQWLRDRADRRAER